MEKNRTGWLERKGGEKKKLCSGVYAIMHRTLNPFDTRTRKRR